LSKVSWMTNEALPLQDPLFIVHMENGEGKYECKKLHRLTDC